jgi:hypothetical protein
LKSISNFRIAFGSAAAFLAVSMAAQCKEQPCSTEKVNGNCVLTIDRVDPLQPPTLQMYPGKEVTVRIKHSLPFEQVSLDWQSSAGSLAPDQASAILNALGSALQKVVAAVTSPAPAPVPVPNTRPAPSPDKCPATFTDAGAAEACAAQMMEDAKLAIVDIGALVNDDTVVFYTKGMPRPLQSATDYHDRRARILCRVLGSSVMELDGKSRVCPGPPDPHYHDLVAEQDNLNVFVSTPPANSDIPALVNYTSTLITALESVAQDLLQLPPAQPPENAKDVLSGADLGTIVDPVRAKNPGATSCNSSHSAGVPMPIGQSYGLLLQRQVSCAVNVFNLVGNSIASIPTAQQKRTIVTIAVNYADSRIETSTGIMVSALPSRSFAANPVYSGTPPSVSNIVVQESDARPLIVPYAAVHVRLGSDWLWPDRRRGAFYVTILAGVNPNTTTADFGAGFSISWRSLVLSPVAHFAHDVRLTGGFTNGESLGPSFTGSVPTQQFWTTSFGFGIGIRIPLITGR